LTKGGLPDDTEGGAERIRKAAIKLFRERGYHQTSVRDLARAVDMETASLYYHYPSKHEILIELIKGPMDDMLAGIEQAVAAEVGAAQRLRAAVRFHVGFHVARQSESFISHSELRAIDKEHVPALIAKRDRYEKFMRSLLDEGVEEGCFEIADVRIAATAILMMCSGVSDWFERRGRLSGAQVADHYADMVLRMVASPAGATAGAAKDAARPRKVVGRVRVVRS
jgi:AcrR family transcriptional regulator